MVRRDVGQSDGRRDARAVFQPLRATGDRERITPRARRRRQRHTIGKLSLVMRDRENSGLVLYTTSACSACEAALDALLSMPELRGFALDTFDVSDDDGLFQRYGERVPVLAWQWRELNWPFDRADVGKFLKLSVQKFTSM